MIGLNRVSIGMSIHTTPWNEPTAKTGKHADIIIPDKLQRNTGPIIIHVVVVSLTAQHSTAVTSLHQSISVYRLEVTLMTRRQQGHLICINIVHRSRGDLWTWLILEIHTESRRRRRRRRQRVVVEDRSVTPV